MIWYCDSSALVKRYVREAGSRWLREQAGPHQLLTSVLTVAEVSAAMARRRRTQFTRHLKAGQYTLLPAHLEVIEQAALLTYDFPLTGYDAVHLATALHYPNRIGVDAEQFYFLTADDQQQRAAQAKGIKTDNPNEYA